MLFAGGCVDQLLKLYHKELVPLLGTRSAPVGGLLLKWLPAARRAINDSGQPPSVQHAVMQLLSRMAHVLMFPAVGSDSSGHIRLGRDASCTPASCEVVFCMVEGLLRSLEGLCVLCSNNSGLWMQPGVVGSTMQQWRVLMVQQPAVPASFLIHQLLQQLGA
jgi:hypothetical protein